MCEREHKKKDTVVCVLCGFARMKLYRMNTGDRTCEQGSQSTEEMKHLCNDPEKK